MGAGAQPSPRSELNTRHNPGLGIMTKRMWGDALPDACSLLRTGKELVNGPASEWA